MNPDKNKKQRKFDYVANLLNYSVNLNRDSDIQLDYNFIQPQQFKFIMDREFPEYQYTNNLCSLINYSRHEMDELNKKLTRFVNGFIPVSCWEQRTGRPSCETCQKTQQKNEYRLCHKPNSLC